jgi:hypothetical protein
MLQISSLPVIPVLFRNQKIGITITTTSVYTVALITFPPAGSFLFSIIFGLGSQGGSGSLTGRPSHIQYVEVGTACNGCPYLDNIVGFYKWGCRFHY